MLVSPHTGRAYSEYPLLFRLLAPRWVGQLSRGMELTFSLEKEGHFMSLVSLIGRGRLDVQ